MKANWICSSRRSPGHGQIPTWCYAAIALLACAIFRGGETRAAGDTFPRIVNGTPTSDYPSVGIIETPIGICSGVLIGCQTFLTAAHCFCDLQPGDACAVNPNALDASSTIVFLQHYGFAEVDSITIHPDYEFTSRSVADLALVHLTTPAAGIAPSPINTVETPATGTKATIVGFGSTEVVGNDDVGVGVKRFGTVSTATCDSGLVCWTFSGSGANTCFGDSGGPLFLPTAGAPVGGITSGGTSQTCAAGDVSFDTDVFAYSAWIADTAGETLGSERCGDLPSAGASGTTITPETGTWDATTEAPISIDVPPGTERLRITLNGTFTGDPDLYLRAGQAPTTTTYDCASRNGSAFEACDIASPASGTWHVLVQGVSGSGSYQLTATTFGSSEAVCGNGVQEDGEACDGAVGTTCDGRCSSSCECIPCTSGVLALRKIRVTPRLRVRGTLTNADGTFGDLDPREGFAITLRDDSGSRAVAEIPSDDAGWKKTRGGFRWRGDRNGLRHVTLQQHGQRVKIVVSGNRVDGGSSLDQSALTVSLSIGGTCVTETP